MLDKKISDVVDVIIADVFADTAFDCFLFGCNQRVKIRNKEDAIDVFMPYWKDKEQKMLEDIPDKLEGMDTEDAEQNADTVVIHFESEEPFVYYWCPDCKKAFAYLMDRVYQLGHEQLFSELKEHGLIVDYNEYLDSIEDMLDITTALKERPELLDFFKAFMDLNPDDQARIIAAAKDTDLLSAIRNSMEVTEG